MPILFLLCYLSRFHIGVDSLNIIEVLKALNHFLYGLTLLVGYFLKVVWNVGELGTCNLEAL